MLVRSSQLPPSDWLAWWLECGRGQVQVCGDLTRHVATSSTAVTSQHLHFLSPAQPSPGEARLITLRMCQLCAGVPLPADQPSKQPSTPPPFSAATKLPIFAATPRSHTTAHTITPPAACIPQPTSHSGQLRGTPAPATLHSLHTAPPAWPQ